MNRTKKVGAYKGFPDKQLIIEYYSGQISLDDLIHLKKTISKEPDYDFSFTTAIDFRDADLTFKPDDMVTVLDYFRKSFKVKDKRKVAYLTSKPNEVVLSTIFTMMLKDYSDLKFEPVTFSTTAAVSSWLNHKDIEEEHIDSILAELRNRPNNVFTVEA